MEEIELLPCVAPLVACLGGVEEKAVIVVSGVPGEGKSTECARVAVELGEPPAFLDAEMSKDRYVVVMQDAGASPAFIRKTARIVGQDWRDALELAQSRSVWIIDSATEWCPQEDEAEFATALVEAAAEGRIIMAIQQWSQKARARGSLKLPHRGDVTIELHDREVVVKKARWGQKGTYPRPRIITPRMKRSAVAAAAMSGNRPRR